MAAAADGLMQPQDGVCVSCPATEGPGNSDCDKENVAVDFISLLPPELLLHVSLCLSPADVTRCLLVCCAWCARLSQLEPYWQVACRTKLLSKFMIQKCGPLFKTWRGLFLAAQNFLRQLSAPPPTTITLTENCPYDVRCSYQYARQGCLVGTVYHHFHPREVVVEIVRGRRWRREQRLKLACESQPEHRVVWGHLLQGRRYVCATASGRWSVYSIRSAPTTTPHSPLYTSVYYPLFDTDLRLGCCERCGLAVTAKLVCYHTLKYPSYWALKLLHVIPHKLRQCDMTLHKVYHNNKNIVGRRVAYGKKGVCLVSKAPPTSTEACSDHLLLLQWANTVSGFVLSRERGETVISPTASLNYIAPGGDIDTALSVMGGLKNSEMALSADKQLLGLVFQARLHVWDVWSGQDIGHIDLPPPAHEPFEEIRLVAVGHFLTVLGLEFSTSLLVVLTQTGQVVTRCVGFAQQHSRMVPPFTELLCVNEEAWLSDITTPCTTDHCMVLFWNKTNRSLEAVLLGEEPVAHDNSPPTRVAGKKHWWEFWK